MDSPIYYNWIGWCFISIAAAFFVATTAAIKKKTNNVKKANHVKHLYIMGVCVCRTAQ